jgi:hypothetical protein
MQPKESVVSTGRSARQTVLLKQNDLHSAQGELISSGDTDCPTANDNDLS